MLKNTCKILFCNLTTTWKILLYKLIVFICVLGLTSFFIMPIINILNKENFFGQVFEVIHSSTFTISFQNFLVGVKQGLFDFWNIVSSYGLEVVTVISICCVVIVYYFFSELYHLSVADCISGYMSSYARYSFVTSFVGNLSKSILFCLVKLIVSLPLTILICVSSVLIFCALSQFLTLATLITVCYTILMISLKNTFLCGWETAICVHNCGIFKALGKSIKANSKKFFKIFSDNVIISLFVFITNMCMIFFTVGAGLVVALPLTSMLLIVYSCVCYFDNTGMRYYLDSNNIYTPKKLEEKDKFSKVQNII